MKRAAAIRWPTWSSPPPPCCAARSCCSPGGRRTCARDCALFRISRLSFLERSRRASAPKATVMHRDVRPGLFGQKQFLQGGRGGFLLIRVHSVFSHNLRNRARVVLQAYAIVLIRSE